MNKHRNTILSFITAIMLFVSINIYNNVYDKIELAFKLNKDNVCALDESNNAKEHDIDLKVSNINNESIPTKKDLYATTSEIKLYPGGQPLGIKLNTKGALVIAISDIETEKGIISPGAKAGIQIGDSILKINNEQVQSSEDVATYINRCDGEEVKITVQRKDEVLQLELKPVKSLNDDKYKIGLWVRDSTAGVGTLTFYDAKSKKFGALGHPITDVDTGNIMSIANGEILSSNIVSVRKGTKGNPGELRGIFIEEETSLGKIENNTECGIFGQGKDTLKNQVYSEPLPVAKREEIKVGPAKILTTVEGTEPKFYDIEIEKLLTQSSPGSKSMVIKITDEKFLEEVGGIVQGMSGSPIIQDGKIVGAVTHVLINKPDTGYGVYIDWMLKDADILSK
ncbi:SpoIVB peptidase [Clostridium ihumii]|uniref:SpoIVB peptidase n=1 Tax=Clostridium ihumii TaxID=1470356 RepID=UPI0009DE0317|nr:SpoIVB peptidase [Clostridium ihumii]